MSFEIRSGIPKKMQKKLHDQLSVNTCWRKAIAKELI